MAQLFPLNVGPSPTPLSIVPETESTSSKTVFASVKTPDSVEFRLPNGPPALGAPPRGPGSVASVTLFAGVGVAIRSSLSDVESVGSFEHAVAAIPANIQNPTSSL